MIVSSDPPVPAYPSSPHLAQCADHNQDKPWTIFVWLQPPFLWRNVPIRFANKLFGEPSQPYPPPLTPRSTQLDPPFVSQVRILGLLSLSAGRASDRRHLVTPGYQSPTHPSILPTLTNLIPHPLVLLTYPHLSPDSVIPPFPT